MQLVLDDQLGRAYPGQVSVEETDARIPPRHACEFVGSSDDEHGMPRVDVLIDDTDRQTGGELAAIGAAGRHEPPRRSGDPDVVWPDRAGAPGTAMQLERVQLLKPHPLAELVGRYLPLA